MRKNKAEEDDLKMWWEWNLKENGQGGRIGNKIWVDVKMGR